MSDTSENSVQFTQDELTYMNNNPIALASGERRDAIRLADAWTAHVEKIDQDRALPWTDRTVWNEHDLCAALTLRDYLDAAIRVLPAPLAVKVSKYADGPDRRFRMITVDDSGKRMAAVAGVDPVGREWWWYRVPDSGPILEDLSRWDRFESE